MSPSRHHRHAVCLQQGFSVRAFKLFSSIFLSLICILCLVSFLTPAESAAAMPASATASTTTLLSDIVPLPLVSVVMEERVIVEREVVTPTGLLRGLPEERPGLRPNYENPPPSVSPPAGGIAAPRGVVTGQKVIYPNNREAPILSWTQTQIQVTVPHTVTDGSVYVVTTNGNSNYAPFAVGSSARPSPSGEGTWVVSHTGTINTDTTWSQNILLTGDVIVASGATLTVTPGVTVFFAAGSDDQSGGLWTNRVELEVLGTLIAEGTEASPIFFTSDATNPAADDWGSIIVRKSSDVSLRFCVVHYAKKGVYFRSKKEGAGTVTGQVFNCTLADNLTGIEMYGNPGYPLGGTLVISPTIANNRIADNTNDGVYISNQTGYGTVYNAAVLLNNVIDDNGNGIDIRASSWWQGHVDIYPTIQNNTISNNTNEGIYIKASGSGDGSGSDTDVQPQIENNLFTVNPEHLSLVLNPLGSDGVQALQPTVRYNFFHTATAGIKIGDTAAYDTLSPTIAYNVFYSTGITGSYAIDNTTSRSIMAQHNYWGDTPAAWDAGPQAGDVNGTVDTRNYLTTSSAAVLTRLDPGAAQTGTPSKLYGANFGVYP